MKTKAHQAVGGLQPIQREYFPTVNDSLELSGRVIPVWRFRTNCTNSSMARHSPILAPNERERANRFRFDHVRRSFVLTRCALRILLGNYLQIDPATIEFSYGNNGKPALAPRSPVQFNVAHTDGMAVLAFALDCEVGVDVERIRSFSGMAGVAARFFHPEEAARVSSFAVKQRERAFFDTWVRKESYIKATGDGLGAGLQDFQIRSQSAAPFANLEIERLGEADTSWSFHDLRLAAHYAGALSYRDHPREVHISPLFTFTELENLLARR